MAGQEFTLEVIPQVPDKISRLDELAGNLWYSWHRPARALFSHLDSPLWDRVGHNPKLFLRRIEQQTLDNAATDEVFLSNYLSLMASYDAYHRETTRREHAARLGEDELVAYFCAEYGFHESFPIYSGGLGILASHHCKTASDLRLPLIAVGLLYRAGYFSQKLDGEGNQIAHYFESNFENLPLQEARNLSGESIQVSIEFPGRIVEAKVWEAHAGHVRLYLLDTDVEKNSEADRAITHQLYGGDRATRIEQEVILGVGGVRALQALGLQPTVWHMNEGHPAFLILERIQRLVDTGLEFAAALEYVAASSVFTTHTPVPAGHDYFSKGLIQPYFHSLFREIGVDEKVLLSLGQSHNDGEDFNMTMLALRGSRHHNGVSEIHGTVSQELCSASWPQIPPEENPMGFITNGVHVPTVLAPEWSELFDRFLGAGWRTRLCDAEYWHGVHQIPDHLFWSVRQSIKSKMLRSVRAYLTRQHLRNQVSEPHLERMLKYIQPNDPNVLTVGFARRFATYKRATLLFADLEWLKELMSDAKRPIVFIFCGKAHPADIPGQQLIKAIHEYSNLPDCVGKVLLVEGYDLGLARQFVAGVDVWLNNPVYSLEASGTSGMKAAVNGTINLSVTDGWWAEGFEGDNGWAIRPSPHQEDETRRDAEDARTLYEILQDHVVPLYYERDDRGYSKAWVEMAKRTMSSILPRFNMTRVVNEYIDKLYYPASITSRALAERDYAPAIELAHWKARIRAAWEGVGLRRLDQPIERIAFGGRLALSLAVGLNGLTPDDVVVEIVFEHRDLPDEPVARGNAPEDNLLASTRGRPQTWIRRVAFEDGLSLSDSGEHLYRLDLEPEWCGRSNYRIRMYPYHPLLAHPLETGLMVWL